MSPPAPDKSALPDSAYHPTTLNARALLGALADPGRGDEALRRAFSRRFPRSVTLLEITEMAEMRGLRRNPQGDRV